MSRQRSGEDQVSSTGGEHEAGTETNVVGDDGEDAVQNSIDNVQGEAQEHEAELEGLGNAANEGADGGGGHQTDGSLLVLGGVDHSQSSAGDTEHHAGEEAGHVHTEAPAHVGGGFTGPVVGQVAQADGVEPEHVVQGVMQTGGDQQAVEEGVQTGANAAQADDAVAQQNQSIEDDGPDEEQDDGNNDGNQAGDDGHAALAAEEGQPVRQLGALELVVAGEPMMAARMPMKALPAVFWKAM